MTTHFTPRAVIDELMRAPVRASVDDARVFDSASGLHPSWGRSLASVPSLQSRSGLPMSDATERSGKVAGTVGFSVGFRRLTRGLVKGSQTVGDAWQPIETAPKDGTVVDLWCERSWHAPETHERAAGCYYCQTHQRWRTVGLEYLVEDTFVPGGGRYLIPTHWRPLPPKVAS